MDENKQIEALAATICSYLRSDSMSRALASLLYEEGWRKDEKLLISDIKSNNSDFKSNKWEDEMLEIIAKAREDYANDVADHTENEYIREGLLNAGYVKQSEGEWISVEDAMPEEEEKEKFIYDPKTFAQLDVMIQDESEEVLVTVVNLYQNRAFVTVDHTINGIWQTWDCGDFMVTHWMPLPQPPKGE